MNSRINIPANSVPWNEFLRPRVGQTVVYNGNYFQNTTGRNSAPQVSNSINWVFVQAVDPINLGNLKIISKAYGNTGQGIEIGDIVSGLLDAGGIVIKFGNYNGDLYGGGIQNLANYTISETSTVEVYSNDFTWTTGAQAFSVPAGTLVQGVYHNRQRLLKTEYTVSGTTVTITYASFEPSETNVVSIDGIKVT